MIRFIDIRGQGTGCRFAFWDTITDEFCKFDGFMAWQDIADFTEYFNAAGGKYRDMVSESGIERFLTLMPDWAAIPMTDDDAL